MRISIGKVFFACLLVGCTAYGITVLRGPHVFTEKHRMIEQLEKENETLNRQIEDKKAYLSRIQQSPEEMGLAIEERLKLVNPGSKVSCFRKNQSKMEIQRPHKVLEAARRTEASPAGACRVIRP